jgi:hypothetical protein
MDYNEVVEWSWAPAFQQTAAVGSVSVRRDQIRHRTYGGYERMSMQNEGAIAPIESGWKPGQIYELCLFEGTLKDQLIANLRKMHPNHRYLTDRKFWVRGLRTVLECLEAIPDTTSLLIIDVGEILYLDFIKDVEQLRPTIEAFYRNLEKLASQGMTCIVFVNYPFYQQIFQQTVRPETVQVMIFPSLTPPFWEAQVTAPPELKSWQSLFRPLQGELPYFL